MSANNYYPARLRERTSAFLASAPQMLPCVALSLAGVALLLESLPEVFHIAVVRLAQAYDMLSQDWRAIFVFTALGAYAGARNCVRGMELAWWVIASASLSCSLAGRGAIPISASLAAPGLIFVATGVAGRWLPPPVRRSIRQAFLVASVAFTLFALHCTKEWSVHFSDIEVFYAGTVGAGAIFSFRRKAAGHFTLPPPEALKQAKTIFEAQSRTGAGLCIAGDKSFLFSDSGLSFLSFAKCGRVWVALSDPIGLPSESVGLISKLTELAHSHGGTAAFHQAHVEQLPDYLDAGLTPMKIGEEAYIDLKEFDLCSPRYSHLRYALRRGQRDGLTFSLIPIEEATPLLPALRRISTDWLTHRNGKELGFSIAAFDETFPATQSIALIRHNSEPVAFVCLMTTATRAEAAIGAMRRTTNAPSITMEYLFTHLALELGRQRFDRLSLGVAPFSEMEHGLAPSLWHRFGRLIGRIGYAHYNVRGLRAFKEKFSPTWEPRYLVASGSIGIFLALATLPLLISGNRS